MHRIKILFKVTLIICFFCTILSQFLMINDEIKNKLSVVHQMESKYVYSEQIIPNGKIEIEISNPEKGIYLLQNGELVAELTEKLFTVEVYDNTVIEIDGRNVKQSFLVKIKSISENLDGYYEREIVVDKNIVILGRFFIK